MKSKKRKNIIIAIAIIVILISGFVCTLLYLNSTVNSYSYSEKQWITNHSEKAFDVYIEPNLPIFSSDGKGVFYEYIGSLKEDTGLNINVITTDNSKIKFVNKNTVEDDDIVFYKDHYVLIGKNAINKLSGLNFKKVGVFESDLNNIKYYLTEYNDITYKKYESFDELLNAYKVGDVDYISIPMYKYIKNIINEDLNIAYHLDGLYSYYCVDNKSGEKDLDEILGKFFNRWESKSISSVNKFFVNIYYDTKGYTELQKESITNEDFIVGYVDNLPFEGMIGNNFSGLTSTYLNKFADMSGVTYKYLKYNDSKALSNALSNKKVDIAMNYYSLNSDKYSNSNVLGNTEYVVLAHVDNNIVVNSLYSLANANVSMLANMNLKYNMASKNLFEINDYANIKQMLKNVDEKSIIIIEKEVYDYYKDSSLRDYSIRYIDNISLNNAFLLNNDNEAFNKLFNFYLSTLSINEVKNESGKEIINTLKENRLFNFIITNLVYIVIGLLIVSLILYVVIKKVTSEKKLKKEDRLYYIDAMTNLKNRNFLNDNMDFWSSNKIYPQTIIVIDINKLKTLNDKYGHEAGDKQIKAVASVLIKTQRDNSEIMRTDGDEFMVYLIGYDEKKIGTYIHKLNRELNDALPNKDYGVSIGYNMILNEQTSIDDAINDSLAMINKSKGK